MKILALGGIQVIKPDRLYVIEIFEHIGSVQEDDLLIRQHIDGISHLVEHDGAGVCTVYDLALRSGHCPGVILRPSEDDMFHTAIVVYRTPEVPAVQHAAALLRRPDVDFAARGAYRRSFLTVADALQGIGVGGGFRHFPAASLRNQNPHILAALDAEVALRGGPSGADHLIVRAVHGVLQVASGNYFCFVFEGLEYPFQMEGKVLSGSDVHFLGDLDVLIIVGVHKGIVVLACIAAAAIIAAEAAVFAVGGAVSQQLSPAIICQFRDLLDEQAVLKGISFLQAVGALADVIDQYVPFKDDIELIGLAVRLVGDQSVRPGVAEFYALFSGFLIVEIDGVAHTRRRRPGAVLIAFQPEGDLRSRCRGGGAAPHDLVDPGIRSEAVQLVLQDHQALYFPDILLGDLLHCAVHDQVAGASGRTLFAVLSGTGSLTVAVPAGNPVLHTATAITDRGFPYPVSPLFECLSG